jgi:hypothetical protein
MFLVIDPWALPTAIEEFHASGIVSPAARRF